MVPRPAIVNIESAWRRRSHRHSSTRAQVTPGEPGHRQSPHFLQHCLDPTTWIRWLKPRMKPSSSLLAPRRQISSYHKMLIRTVLCFLSRVTLVNPGGPGRCDDEDAFKTPEITGLSLVSVPQNATVHAGDEGGTGRSKAIVSPTPCKIPRDWVATRSAQESRDL